MLTSEMELTLDTYIDIPTSTGLPAIVCNILHNLAHSRTLHELYAGLMV